MPFDDARPSGALPLDVVTEFVWDDEARGHPVGLALDKRGAWLVADDVGNTIWRAHKAAAR